MLRYSRFVRIIAFIPFVLLGIAGMVWLVRGIDRGHGFQLATGAYTLALATGLVALLLRPPRAADLAREQVVGGLADVLAALGKELGDAETRSRDRSSIAWSGAELELSVTMEQSNQAGVDFKVVNGEINEGNSQTSALKIMPWPAHDGRPEVGK
jgi:hypothetical protein